MAVGPVVCRRRAKLRDQQFTTVFEEAVFHPLARSQSALDWEALLLEFLSNEDDVVRPYYGRSFDYSKAFDSCLAATLPSTSCVDGASPRTWCNMFEGLGNVIGPLARLVSMAAILSCPHT